MIVEITDCEPLPVEGAIIRIRRGADWRPLVRLRTFKIDWRRELAMEVCAPAIDYRSKVLEFLRRADKAWIISRALPPNQKVDFRHAITFALTRSRAECGCESAVAGAVATASAGNDDKIRVII